MLLSINDLLDLKELPTEDNLNLQTLANFYEQHLCNQIFHYHVTKQEI